MIEEPTIDPAYTKYVDASRIHSKEGQDRGRIVDIDAAQELASVEATKGLNAAMAREKELVEGLTAAQKENLAAMELYPGKYPHAFFPDEEGRVVRINAHGEPFLVTRPLEKNPTIVVTQDGAILLSGHSWELEPIDDSLVPEVSRTVKSAMDSKKNGYLSLGGFSFSEHGNKGATVVDNPGVGRGGSVGSVREMAPRPRELLQKVEEKYIGTPTAPEPTPSIGDIL